MKTDVIIQARMGSTRLPGKVLKPLCGKPMLEHIIDRMRRAKKVDKVLVTTWDLSENDPIGDLCERKGVYLFRGKWGEDTVLSRFYKTAKEYGSDVIVRITSDNPLVDPVLVDNLIDFYQKHDYDYVTLMGYPVGFDAEVFGFKVLEEVFGEADTDYDKEHVTAMMYTHPKFSVGQLWNKKDLSSVRLTVDVYEDYEKVRDIYENLYPDNPEFGWKEVREIL
jgi:spore coat polysaccharide biosynthesis protein SpsF